MTSARNLAVANFNQESFFMVSLSDENTTITTGTAKVTMRIPFNLTLTSIPVSSLNIASTSGNPTVDIKKSGVSILGANKLSINVNEKTSLTATTQTSLATTSLLKDDEITFDISTSGTNAKGLKVTLFYKKA